MLDAANAVVWLLPAPAPLSKYVKILTPCSCQCLTRAFWTFVETKRQMPDQMGELRKQTTSFALAKSNGTPEIFGGIEKCSHDGTLIYSPT